MPKKVKTLSEKLQAAFEGGAPEDILQKDGDELDIPRTVGDEEVENDPELDYSFAHNSISSLRAQNSVSLADTDSKYRGQKTSRRELNEERLLPSQKPKKKKKKTKVLRGDLDEVEHSNAELGYLFERGSDDDSHDSGNFEESDEAKDGDEEVEEEIEIEEEEEEEDDEEEDNDIEIEEETDQKEIINEESDGESFDDSPPIETKTRKRKYEEFEFDKEKELSSYYDDDEEENDESSDEFMDVESESTKFTPGDITVEVEKGKCIKSQIALYDHLLELRIGFQKILNSSMKLPKPENWISSIQNSTESIQEAKKSLKLFYFSLAEAKDALINGTDSLKTLKLSSYTQGAKKSKLKDLEKSIIANESSLKSWRNDIIEKWSDKTRFASTSTKGFSSFEGSALKQIDHILSDKDRLLKRTRTKRSEYVIIGDEEADVPEFDSEIFDDDDFYHQLLRELIAAKTAGVEDSSLSAQHWVNVQKIRSKMKKKTSVDTKASKGRKIRYDIHSKLVNFMAPVYGHSMNEDAKNELFSSLFGKRKESEINL